MTDLGEDRERPHVVDVIRAKRDGRELSATQIDAVVAGYARGDVAEEQMSALAMAILLNGMGSQELARWTRSMIASGSTLDWGGLGRPTADKHSTGGVGDKITLVLAPLVAACGVAVPQLSGRGLGHTGGTLDKLEAIPGWQASRTLPQMRRQLREVGAFVCATTKDLAPADRRLYALRDVTATVESVPLIASSIMSKKIAAGPESLVLDVKVGSGAFMKSQERAEELAETMVSLGQAAGVRTSALLTDMAVPLGRAVGNAPEVVEALEVLDGRGPADVVELTLVLAEEMLRLAGSDADPASVLASGRAMEVWRSMVRAQGGDPDAALPEAPHAQPVLCKSEGVLQTLDALAVGRCAWWLGAGRARPGDVVDATAGVTIHARPGDPVRVGTPLLTMRTSDPSRLEGALAALDEAWTVAAGRPPSRPLVLGRVSA